MTATIYSTDYGATFASPVDAGDGGDLGGADTSKVGTVLLLSSSVQTYKQSAGGAFASYGTAENEGCVVIPRHTFASSSTDNNATNPEYLLIADAEDSGESMWKVTSTGGTFTDITKTIGGHVGLSSGMNCADLGWDSATRMAALLLYSSQLKLITSSTIGVTWTERGDLDGDTGYIRFRRGDSNMRQLYFLAGGIPYFSANLGQVYAVRTYPEDPDSAPALFIEPYG